MKRAMVDPAKCLNCSVWDVADNCPQQAIIREINDDKPWIDFYGCRGCMKCKVFCKHQAVLEIIKPCDGSFASSW